MRTAASVSARALARMDSWMHKRDFKGPVGRLICDLYDLSVGVPSYIIKRERRDRRRR